MRKSKEAKVTKSKPTQLPWKPGATGTVYAIDAGELVAIAQFHPRGEVIKWPESQANVHLVCRAVNAHEKLVEAFTTLLSQADANFKHYGTGIPETARDRARAILDEAVKGPFV